MYLDHIHSQFPSPTLLHVLPTFKSQRPLCLHEHGKPISDYTLEEQ